MSILSIFRKGINIHTKHQQFFNHFVKNFNRISFVFHGYSYSTSKYPLQSKAIMKVSHSISAYEACQIIRNLRKSKELKNECTNDRKYAIEEAFVIFNRIDSNHMTCYLLNAMMQLLTDCQMSRKALEMYAKYEQFHDNASHVLAIKTCIYNSNIEYAKDIIESKLDLKDENINDYSIKLLNTLIDFFGSHCSDVNSAERIFNAIPFQKRDAITIGALMKGFTVNGKSKKALQMYEEYEQFNNNASHVLAIKACISDGNIEYGKNIIQSKICLKDEYINDHSIELLNTLIDFYGVHCSDVNTAEEIFNAIALQKRDVITINAMMNVYRMNEMNIECLEFFENIFCSTVGDNYIVADCVSFVIALQACTEGTALYFGRKIHELLPDEISYDLNVEINLISMYGKCGQLQECRAIFEKVKEKEYEKYCKDIQFFHSMIFACAKNGALSQAIEVWNDMKNETSLVSNAKTYSILINACSHAGDVEQARNIFHAIVTENIKFNDYVRSSFVDVLSRAGFLDEALQSILQYEKYRAGSKTEKCFPSMWMALLGGCQKNKNKEMSLIVYTHMKERFADFTGVMINASVLFSNTFASNTDFESDS